MRRRDHRPSVQKYNGPESIVHTADWLIHRQELLLYGAYSAVYTSRRSVHEQLLQLLAYRNLERDAVWPVYGRPAGRQCYSRPIDGIIHTASATTPDKRQSSLAFPVVRCRQTVGHCPTPYAAKSSASLRLSNVDRYSGPPSSLFPTDGAVPLCALYALPESRAYANLLRSILNAVCSSRSPTIFAGWWSTSPAACV